MNRITKLVLAIASFTLVGSSMIGCDSDEKKKSRIRPLCQEHVKEYGLEGKMTVDQCADQALELSKKCGDNFAEVHICLLQAKGGMDGKKEADCMKECKSK